jgi:TetR/AcrR family transcriptional repressor of nem operon
MRYEPKHKARTRERIVKNASRQFRAGGLNGPGVIQVMKASGLTHGGFYKHFKSRDDLLVEAIGKSVCEMSARLVEPAKQARPEEPWKEVVSRYLSLEHCERPEIGCPMAALAPDIARAAPALSRRIRAGMEGYRRQLVECMPGRNPAEREKNFILIFTAMLGALQLARTMSSVEEKQRILGQVRDHLLASF